MTDLSSLSDDQLKAMYAQTAAPAPDLSQLSDDDLKALHASTVAPAAPVAEPKSTLQTIRESIQAPTRILENGVMLGLGDRARAAIDSVLSGFSGYGQHLKEQQDETAQFAKDHPIAAPVIEAVGGAGIPVGVIGAAAKPASLATKSLVGAGTGAALGAVQGAANSKDWTDLPQVASDTLTGGETGAVLGGVLPAAAKGIGAAYETVANRLGGSTVASPTVAALKDAARAAYKSPEVEAVEIHPQSTADLSTKIENDLLQKGFRPANTPGVFEEVQALNPISPPKAPAFWDRVQSEMNGQPLPEVPQVTSVKVADLDSSRKALGVYAKERDSVGQPTARAAAAQTAIDHINEYLPNLKQSDLIAGDAARASKILDEARQDWGAAKRAQAIDLQLTRADRQAAKSGSGSNIENAMRQKVATLLDNPKRTVGFSEPEKQAMETIVRGDVPRNVLRKVGKLGVDGGLSLLLHTGSAISTGGATLPIAVGGTAARKVGEALTARAGRDLSEMVRSRSALADKNQAIQNVVEALRRHSNATTAPYAGNVGGVVAALLGKAGADELRANPKQKHLQR